MAFSLFPVAMLFEFNELVNEEKILGFTSTTFFVLSSSSFLALFMIISEFFLVRETSSITMSVLGILKEVITILISVLFLSEDVDTLAIVGLEISIFGLIAFNTYKYFQVVENENNEKSKEGMKEVEINEKK